MITASAPAGIGAPVATSTHAPAVTATVGMSPVKTRPASRRRRGASRVAPVVSAATTA